MYADKEYYENVYGGTLIDEEQIEKQLTTAGRLIR